LANASLYSDGVSISSTVFAVLTMLTNTDMRMACISWAKNKVVKGSPYSITKRRVAELIPVFGSQLAGDVSHKLAGIGCHSFSPGLQLHLKRVATSFAVL